MAEQVVSDFNNIVCSGCGQPAAISTKVGTAITCSCGLVHTTKGVLVDTTGTCSNPEWLKSKQAADRAARLKEKH
jgi:hypothetical protein